MTTAWKAHAGLLLTNLIFGSNYSIVQYIAARGVQPFGLNVIRVGVTTVLLWLLIFFVPHKPGIRREHIGRMLVCALTGIVINQLLFIKGLTLTLSMHASLLMLVTPVFVTVTAAWLIKESLNIYKLVGLAAGIGGAVMLVLLKENTAAHNGGSNILLGNMLIVINAISYAFYFVLVKPLMEVYHPFHVIRWMFTLGLIFVLPIGWGEFAAIEWQTLQVMGYAALAFIVIGATFLAYLFNLYGIAKLGASIAGAYIYTQPFFASIIAIFILDETLSLYKIIAALLIIAGVVLVNKKV
ncbi:MAG TPA: DMT family transporter [Chitinophagaceae bacterium]|nr:DMT family transporter [Chitinophagaceae bacterium]